MKKNTVLHITPHLGGGVGRVLLNYFLKTKDDPYFAHKIACLDYANQEATDALKNIGLELSDKMSFQKEKLLGDIAEADIVIIHWWNHPLLYDFLVREQLPPCRLIIWSHNSGFYPPGVFTDKILNYPDLFVFTTPASFKTKEVKNLSGKQEKNLRVVWSTAGVEYVRSVEPKKHAGFNIGYIGTVDYAKIHSNFLKICNKINIPDVKFIVCGGPSEKEFREETKKMGIAEKFDFTGQVARITEYLSIFDIFGYPLSPYHYGTCDQSLAESMAAGVVPVVLQNRMEKYMVKDGITGIVAKSEKDYIKAIQKLYKNKKLRDSLSKNARLHALDFFSADKMVREWEVIFKEISLIPKASKKWNINKKNSEISAKDVFLESLGAYGKIFADEKKIIKLGESHIWKANTRGTVHHYNYFFPNDETISLWSNLMSDGELKKI
jgi:glycosyltransferase involved in cell wall biosynthesis